MSDAETKGRRPPGVVAAVRASFTNMKDMDYRMWIGMSGVLAGLIAAIINLVQGDPIPAAILLAIVALCFGLLVWWTQPNRSGLHMDHATAQATAQDGDVIIYWRPG